MTIGKVLLVNYAGYWMTANSFIADSSLALLAGILLQNNIETEIIDFQNPNDIGKIMEYDNMPWAEGIIESLNQKVPMKDEDLEGYSKQRSEGQRLFEEEKTKWLIEKIAQENIQAIGFKLWIGNGLLGTISMAKKIKEKFPHLKLIAGGPGVQFAQNFFYDFTDVFDHAVYGEAEEILVPLLKGQTDVDNLLGPKTMTKKSFLADLNDNPMPVYDPKIYPNIESFYKIRIIDDSRGCFNKCSFCSHTTFSGTSIRKKEVKRVVDEIQKSFVEEGVQYFRLSGSNPPWKFLVGIGEEILKRKLPVFYSAFSSFNNTNKADFPLLYKSGLRSILYGLESGDEAYLKRIHNKSNLSHKHIIETSKEAMKNNIFIGISVIYPSPFETEETGNTTLNLIREIFSELNHGSIFCSPPLLSPGSLWWNNMETYGLSFPEGYDKKKYTEEVMIWDANFLLPRDKIKSLPYLVDNKSCSQVFLENQNFLKKIESMGITTNIDDTAFMLSLLKGQNPFEFKKMAMQNLILGGQSRLAGQVQSNPNENLNAWP